MPELKDIDDWLELDPKDKNYGLAGRLRRLIAEAGGGAS